MLEAQGKDKVDLLEPSFMLYLRGITFRFRASIAMDVFTEVGVGFNEWLQERFREKKRQRRRDLVGGVVGQERRSWKVQVAGGSFEAIFI